MRTLNYLEVVDEQLMVLVIRNDQKAFSELYRRYSKRLLYYFYRMLGSDEEKSQDFLQDIFMKVIERPEQFDSRRKFSTWIFSIAHNMCKNEYRKMDVRNHVNGEEHLSMVPSFDLEGEKQVDLKDFSNKLFIELETLSEQHKTAFLLRNREGFSIKEISEVMECNEGTVKSRIFYATKKLAVKLHAYKPQN